jgi:RimJ/RimL family protein N-acetyltransferase
MNLSNAQIKQITEKAVLESFFRRDPGLHLYSIGYLDDFFWSHTAWYGIENHTELRSIFLIHSGSELPVLLALEDSDKSASEKLLTSLIPKLPDHFYSHLSPGLHQLLRENGFLLEPHGEHLKMSLEKLIIPNDVLSFEMSCRRLTVDDLDVAKNLYAKAYPGNWFDPRILETGKYFGAFDDDVMVGIAGIHVYSRCYRVAALGNITTLVAYRGQGIAAKLTAELCKDLLADGIKNIGLNVKSDNQRAIHCYQKIGFQIQTKYDEFMIHKRPGVI